MIKTFSQDNIQALTSLLKKNSGKADTVGYSVKVDKVKMRSSRRRLTAEEKLLMVKKNLKDINGSFIKNNRSLLQNIFKYSYLWIVSFAFAFSILQFGDSAISAFQGTLFNIISSFKG